MLAKFCSTKIVSNLGPWRALTYLEINLLVQIIGLAIQLSISSTFKSNPSINLCYNFSMANLLILSARYLSRECDERQKLKLFSTLLHIVALSLVTIVPCLILPFITHMSNSRFVTAVMAFALGLMIEVAAETQKKIFIKYNKGKLVQDGMFKYIRNPEILGASVKNLSFLMLCQLPLIYLVAAPLSIYLIYLSIKLRTEKLAEKQGGKEYISNTYAIWPKFFPNDMMNIAIVVGFVGFLCLDYNAGGYITKLNSNHHPHISKTIALQNL